VNGIEKAADGSFLRVMETGRLGGAIAATVFILSQV
jgi:hypothetical protein